jgi:hypothetical protein
MDTLTILLATAAGLGVIALAFLSGYEIGDRDATLSERSLADHRIRGILAGERRIGAVIDYENRRKPKARKNRIKAARKGFSGGALV